VFIIIIINATDMPTKALTLTGDIASSLRIELGGSADVSCPDGKLTVVLSSIDCEKNYGHILLQIHRVIDERCPDRNENVFIHLQDQAGTFHNVLKIWKSV
jgi:hypothetical protein